MTTETDIQRRIQLALSTPTGRIWRNTVGAAWHGRTFTIVDGRLVSGKASYVRYGLAPGSSDLIGPQSIEITADMVGRRIAVFAAIETKTEKGRLTNEQGRFIDTIVDLGGIAGCARSVEEALCIVEGFTD